MQGKTAEKLQNRCIFKIVTHAKKLLREVAKSNVLDAQVMSQNVVITRHLQTKVYQDRPCYIAASVLDLARTMMAEHFFNFKKAFHDAASVKACATDTDSILWSVS